MWLKNIFDVENHINILCLLNEQRKEGLMEKIIVSLTVCEKRSLEEIAGNHNASPSELLAAFVADLVGSERAGGSDERMYASDWLCRQTDRWHNGKM